MESNVNKNQEVVEIDLSVLFHTFLRMVPRMIWLPILLFVLTAAGRFTYLRWFYHPIYETTAVYRVGANQTGSLDMDSYGYYLDANAANKLATTYNYVMNSDQSLQLLMGRYGVEELPSEVTCTAETAIVVFTSRAESAQDSYNGLLMATDIFPVASASVLGNFVLEVFDEPVYPTGPVKPINNVVSSLLWGLIGLAVGMGLILVLSLFRKTIHNTADLRDLLNVPCLGLLPQVRFKARTGGDKSILLTNQKLPEYYAESIRGVRFQLHKALETQEASVIMINSTVPGEGKSTFSSNLALALAEQGSRVVLVDCDLRKQTLKDLFGITEASRGLVELISEQDKDLEGALVPVKGSSLLLLSGDKVADQPQNFLTSPRLRGIINTLRKSFDFVVVDTPPSGLLSDASALSQWVDGSIFVVRQDFASRSALIDSVTALSGMDVRFIGCVLNQAASNTSASGYGYGAKGSYGYGNYGYGYGYGYGGYGHGYGYGSSYGKNEKDREENKAYTK